MNSLHTALRAAALVSQMAIQTVVAAWLGSWLDGWLGSSPIAVLALGGAGFASGLFVTWRAFVAASDSDESESHEEPPSHDAH